MKLKTTFEAITFNKPIVVAVVVVFEHLNLIVFITQFSFVRFNLAVFIRQFSSGSLKGPER